MVLREETVTGRRVLRLVSGRAGVPLPWIPDQVRNDGWWRAARGGWRRRLGGSRPAPLDSGSESGTTVGGGRPVEGWRRRSSLRSGSSRAAPLGCGSSPETRGVKCGRRGAVRAATANHRLRFLGFARNDRGALWWNDRSRNRSRNSARSGGRELYGWRASGPVLARDARGSYGSSLRSRMNIVRALRMTLGNSR